MHRFTTKETKSIDKKIRVRFLYFLAPVLIALFLFFISSVSDDTLSKQEESLQNAIHRDVLHCYAVEGFYPPSLSYLEEHYGLTYDHEHFLIDYQPIGDNIQPDVTILILKGGNKNE